MLGTATIVRRVLTRELLLSFKCKEATDDATLRGDLTADSIDMIGVACAIEDACDVALSDEELAGIETVGELIALVDRKVGEA